MKNLFLLRHAKSSWDQPGLEDHDRPLNARGREACSRLANHLRKSQTRIDYILVSTARRTQETCDRIQPALGGAQGREDRSDLYLAGPAAIERAIMSAPHEAQNLMILGHNPGLEDYAQALAKRGKPNTEALQRLQRKYPTAGLTEFRIDIDSWADMPRAQAILISFITPKMLGGIDEG